MENKFEDYLKTKFSEESPSVLDDDMPDAFDSWLGELSADDFISFADQYHETK